MKTQHRQWYYRSRANIAASSLATSRLLVCTAGMLLAAKGMAVEPDKVARYHDAQAEHCDQQEMLGITDPHERFEETFECGDELFATRFNILDGVGANVGNNLRFTRVPRADMNGPNEWADHIPSRATGPNAEACTICHVEPFEDGSGAAGLNVVRDPLHTANTAQYIQRNTPHLFGAGALQRLAEEMTEELHSKITQGRDDACAQGSNVSVPLDAKGVSFGAALIACDGNDDLSGLEGIDNDLVVKAFQWKGNTKTLRKFNREASHNELGMQAVELVGYNTDSDGDSISDEFSIGDITALSVYVAGQPRPATKLELNRLGLLDLTREEIDSIRRGEDVFDRTGCADCHRPQMVIRQPVFSEPSQTPEFMELAFPAGQLTVSEGVDPDNPIHFDLTADQPDNVMQVNGRTIHFGAFEKSRDGGAIVRLYGDLKRHDMGEGLAENIDETGTGASVWLTKELWGVGSTAPYLHDGRATTLTEAILDHGGEAGEARDAAANLSDTEFVDMIAFLDNLILYKVQEDEVVVFGDRRARDRSRRRDRRRESRR